MAFPRTGKDGKGFAVLYIGDSMLSEESYDYIYLDVEKVIEKKIKYKHKQGDK